jgi:hypothetical protein
VSNLSEDAPDVLAERVMTKDVRDPAVLVERVASRLSTRIAGNSEIRLPGVQAASGNGMSCVTLVMDCSWDGTGTQQRRLVTRIAPDTESFPVFPTYDLPLQYDVIGSPFLVLEYVEGRAPLDNP